MSEEEEKEHKKNRSETHTIDLAEAETQVEVCCSHTSIYGLKYISRIALSIMMMTFAFVQIARFPSSDNSIYFSILSSILGYYLSIVDRNTL